MSLLLRLYLPLRKCQLRGLSHGYFALWLIWLSMLTHLQLNFTERIKAETFGRVHKHIGQCHSAVQCKRDSKFACDSCRYAICCWIHTLELQSMRAALNSTVRVHEIPRNGHCHICKSVPEWCCYIPSVVEEFKKGFAAIPRLVDFKLHPEQYSRLPSWPDARARPFRHREVF